VLFILGISDTGEGAVVSKNVKKEPHPRVWFRELNRDYSAER
jgi:hypothetical protein